MVTNTAAPFGFRQFGRQDGGSPTAGLTRATIVASDTNLYYTGDVVAISTASGFAGSITLPASGVTTGNPILGVFLGCEYYSPSVGKTVWNSYYPASQGSSALYNAYVCTDPDQLYIAQGTSVAILGTSVIGFNIGFTTGQTGSSQTGGNQITGVSNIGILSSAVSANSSYPFRIVDTYANYAPPGVNGTSSGSEGLQIMVVQPNNFLRRSLTGQTT